MGDSHAKLETELFERALEVPADQWRQFLEKECDERLLIDRVLDLLRISQLDNEFLPNLADMSLLDPADVEVPRKTNATLPAPPESIGSYQLIEFIDEGGMAVVYKARHTSTRRIVAIKMIREGRASSPSSVQRFRREVKAASKLSHPNIVAIHEAGEQEGINYYSMDYIDGISLTDLIKKGPLKPLEAARYLKKIADAMQSAHDCGILHRDLTPNNILLDHDDEPLVSDFGLAKQLDNTSELTRTGTTLGTPGYMPPEQAEGKHDELKPTCDIYSLGAILYAMLSGNAPFHATSAIKAIYQVIHSQPKLIPGADPNLMAISLKCLQKNPKHRYQTATELADELCRYVDGEPIRAALRSRRFPDQQQEFLINRRTAKVSAIASLFGIAMLILLVFWPHLSRHPIKVVAGKRTGQYYAFSLELGDVLNETFGQQIDVKTTNGARENIVLLQNGNADLALMQANVFSPESGAVIAPLYYEYVVIVVREDRSISTLHDLNGKVISVGDPTSGMRQSADSILLAFGIEPAKRRGVDFDHMRTDEEIDAAIVTAGPNHMGLLNLIRDDRFRVVSINYDEKIARKLGGFEKRVFSSNPLQNEIETLATPALLIAPKDASDTLVEMVLECLYPNGAPNWNLPAADLQIPSDVLSVWRNQLHPAARRFFEELANSSVSSH